MIDSVLRIKEPFQKVTDDEFSEEDFQKLKEISDALNPVKELTTIICSESANLLTADVAYIECLKWLKNQKSQLSKDLYTKLLER